MKTFYSVTLRYVYAIFSVTALLVSVLPAAAQNATVAIPIGIGKQCSGGGQDSVKYFNYNSTSNILTHRSNCKPSLAFPGFSSSLATITFNPFDQFLYFTQIKATLGIYSSYTYRWAPTTCPGPSAAVYKTFTNQFVAGVEFDPNTGLGYQFNFVDSTGYAPLSVDATGNVGQFTSAAVVNGNPSMAYYDVTNQKLKFVRALDPSGQNWATPVTITPTTNVGQYPSLYIVNGNPAIAYYDVTNGDLKYVRATDVDGTTWGAPITIDAGGNVGQFASLVVVNGFPAVSYYDVTNLDLKYVRATDANGTTWGSSLAVASTGNIGQYTSMQVVNGNPAISYYDASNGDVMFTRATNVSGTTWGAPLTVEGTGNIGQYTSMQVVNGNPAIAYYDVTNADLRYIQASNASGTAWNTPVAIAATGNVGQFNSLIVVNGSPAISYFDVTNGDLKYVRANDVNGAAWGTQYTCEATGSVGQYSSMIVSSGNPAVCYYDVTNADVKFVRANDVNGTIWYKNTGIFKMELQKVDFATGLLGISRPIDFRDGTGAQKYIYQQNGDVVMTPGGKMLACWDNKYMTVNWQDYASAVPLVATYIDSFKFGAAGIDMIGLAYSDGKLVGSVKNKNTVCSSFYTEIDILSGVLSPITYNAGSPFTNSADMTDITSGIGVAKRLVSAIENPVGSKTYDIVYEVVIKNYGGTPVTNVQAYDTLTKINGALNYVSGSITSFSAPAGFSANASFNGVPITGFTNLFSSVGTLSNIPGQNTITLRIAARVANIQPGVYYYNQAFVNANGLFGDNLRDASTDGANPDLNGNSKPDDVGEAQPTPLLIQVTPTTAPCASLTNVLYTQDFGAGTGLVSAIPAAIYGSGVTPGTDAIAYTSSVTQPIPDETYTITNQANNANTSRFISLTDHTANTNGRMLVVNADANNSKIYAVNFTKTLCANQQYSLVFYAAFVGNPSYNTICSAFGGFVYPKIKMQIKDGATGSVISAISTSNITGGAWAQYGFKFTPPVSFSNIVIELINDAPGGCGNDVAIDDIQFGSCDALPSVSVGTGSASCMGTSTTFNSSLSDPGAISGTIVYQWQIANALAGPYADIAGATSSTYTISSLAAADTGKYYRLIVAASGNMGTAGCQYTSPGILLSGITPSTGPSSVSATGSNICAGTSTTLTAVGASLGTGANYQWGTGSVVGTSPIVGATSSTLTVSPGTTTTYWVQIQNNTAPCSATAGGITKVITVNQPSVAPSSVSGADICGASSTTLTAIGGALGTGANYQWGTGSVVGTSPIVGATGSTLTVSPGSTTTYWVQIQNGTAPCSATTSGLTKVITVSQPSVAPSSVTGADICSGASTTLTAVGASLGTGANYQWGTGSVVGTSPIVGATSSTLTVSPGSTTTYWVQIQNGTAPCSATTSGLTKVITVNQASVAPSSVTGADICGATSTTLTALGGALGTGANYQWGTGSVVGTSPIVGATGSTLTVSPGSTTTYWVQIQNNASPCAATTSGLTKVITVSQPSVAPSSITGANICAGGSTTLTAVGASLGTGANYQWGTGSVVGTSPIVGATSSTLTVSPGSTTTYWVQIQNTSSPCGATTSGLTKVITVDQLSVAATGAAKNRNNICPGIVVNLTTIGGTLGTGASWKWYTGSPGGTLIGGGTSINVTPSVTTTYYVRAEGSCNTTADQAVTVFISCDIDKDKDGIPDYVESNIPAALANAYNTGYAGYKDNNNDFINDDFQADGDSDNDGIPNYLDTTFPGRVDSNGDGVDDRFDADKDGVINMLDLDSDNDGIADVVEAYGVDTDGDGKIDSFTDTDGDGLSQNVDANNTGANNTGTGLGSIDFDGDGVPNFIDLDSDNDGIPDVVETGGPDTNNNGMIDAFVDANADGLHDGYINGTALLLTGVDGNADGRADSWPNKNLDRDLRPNAYDMDSDGDGIIDIIEAGFADVVSPFGVVDGAIGSNGWSGSVSSLVALNLRNTDASGNPDYLDIDSDNDGIPDNIEGMSTAGYIRPVSLTDTDGDGLINHYDNVSGFGGTGIQVYDHDGDGIPDYRDLDTDGDGYLDIIEGNDFNLNGYADDLVTLTGLDTDGDGLDNRFDSLNSVTNLKGTSYNMGSGGSTSGDAAPGSRCTVQKKTPAQIDRDWRFIGTVLPVQFLNFSGFVQNRQVPLQWTIITTKEIDHFEIERSTDNTNYTNAGIINPAVKLNEQQSFVFTDDITGLNTDIIYYRLKVIGKAGEIKYSNILVIRMKQTVATTVTVVPNPATDYIAIKFVAEKASEVTIKLIDNSGKTVLLQKQKVSKGSNVIGMHNLGRYSAGLYTIQVFVNNEIATQKIIINH
jgi:hypothetical protein